MRVKKEIMKLLAIGIVALACTSWSSSVHAEEKAMQSEVKYIHLNSVDGDDNKDGLTKESAVRTFEKAKSLLRDGDIILIDSNISITKDEVWDMTDKPNSKLQRNVGGDVIEIRGNHTLTLNQVVLDGTPYEGADYKTQSLISMGVAAGKKENGSKLILNSGTILENNNAPQLQGAAIAGYSYNTVVMNENSCIRNNGSLEVSAIFGGAISLENHGKFIMNGGVIEQNHAARGGGVSLIASSMEMKGGEIKNNTANSDRTYAGHYGGGIYLSNFQDWSTVGHDYSREIAGEASFVMTGGLISGNQAVYQKNGDNGKGGAIGTYPAFAKGYEFEPAITIDIQGGEISNNEAIDGGAISAYFDAVDVKISNTTISNNKAQLQGGAIYGVFNAKLDLTDAVIESNQAAVGGGAYLYASELNMNSGEIKNNQASVKGGGIYIDAPAWHDKTAVCTILGGTVSGNTAAAGKGSDGIYQDGTLNIGEKVSVDKNNDVYLPSGKIIDTIRPLENINRTNFVSITSEDCAIEEEEQPGTRLVCYHAEAGGEEAAVAAEENQLYIPSQYMQEGLVIGKSQADEQLDFMTYIKKEKYKVSYEYVSGTDGKELPKEVKDLCPIDGSQYLEGTTIHAVQPVEMEVRVAEGTWKFEGYDQNSKVANAENADENNTIKFTGVWKFQKHSEQIVPGGSGSNPDKPNTTKPNPNTHTVSDAPKTGDEANVMLWEGLLISSLLVVYAVYRKLRKSRMC